MVTRPPMLYVHDVKEKAGSRVGGYRDKNVEIFFVGTVKQEAWMKTNDIYGCSERVSWRKMIRCGGP